MATAFSVVILAVCFALPASVTAQTDRAAPEDVRILEVVDRLREIIQQAERNRSTDRATLGALRDVVNTYDWPWRRKLLFDDFGDGNFTANPAWTVSRGDFRVVRGLGLQTSGRGDAVVSPGPADGGTGPGSGGPSVIEGILGGILKGVFERGPSTQFRANTVAAEIFTPVAIGNAFAVRVRMASRE
ncbi:MAG: hypothetical protein FJ143_04745, partial [Deltaproteobacteria bacterium]|nr:hypothetical protein [Deltaproteobacteria bacterium]